jgi:DNA-binding GntR family transcriptional regulator
MRSIDIQSTQDSVVKAIQSAIFSGELKMGQRILEDELAETFQISRATVREALRRLEQVGLVQIKPRRGTFVTRLSMKEVEHTCRLRAALEGLAARYASERLTKDDWQAIKNVVAEMKVAADAIDLTAFLNLDRRFHELIWTLAADDQLEYILRFLSTPYFAFVASISTLLFSDVSKVYRAHENYLNVLQGGNPEQVQKKVQEIHEGLAARFMADVHRAQASMPGKIFSLEEGD